jgi:uncharacterized protein
MIERLLPSSRVTATPFLSALFALAIATGCASTAPTAVCPETQVAASLWPATLDHPSTPETQRAAVNRLFEVIQLQSELDHALDLNFKIQMEENPTIRPLESIMRKFLSKYLSLDGIREPLARLFMDRFSELELVQLTAFYKTPLGQRSLTELPKLTGEGSKIGMKKVQEHLKDLEEMVRQQIESGQGKPTPDRD